MEIILSIIFGFIAFMLLILFIGWLFDLPLMLKHFRAQTKLLERIAEKHGVPEQELKDIVRKAK